ncbi:MAG: amino acid adenylation domain-containing protein [Halanaerobiales bacterium]|nr:amino acid adenylation domain-containing protein [Halanaerobiales bacterium]
MSIKVIYKGKELQFDKPPTPKEIKEKYEKVANEVSVTREVLSIEQPPELKPIEERDKYPLSYIQKSIWLAEQINSKLSSNVVAFATELSGELNKEVFYRSIEALIKRHSILNTRFATEQGVPYQRIVPEKIDIIETDISDLQDTITEMKRIEREWVNKPFDLEIDPLIRIQLIRRGKDEHTVLFVIHHLIFDGESLTIFVNDWCDIYDAFDNGKEPELEKLPVQYTDYTVWEKNHLHFDIEEAYWKKKLSGDLPVIKLPSDHTHSANISNKSDVYYQKIDKELLQKIRILGRQKGASLYMVFLTTFKIFLNRYTGIENVIVGTPVSTRQQKETEKMCGCFINTLALRTNLMGDPSFTELIGRIRFTVMESFKHLKYPFSRLVEVLNPQRDSSYSPIFQVSMGLMENPFISKELSTLKVKTYEIEPDSLDFDLHLDIIDENDVLWVKWQYRSDLFLEDTIKLMASHFKSLLRNIVKSSDCNMSTLEMLSQSEKELILNDFNSTKHEFQQTCAHKFVEQRSLEKPDSVAVVQGDREIIFGQLNKRANQLAHHLIVQGVGQGKIVAICMKQSIDMIIAALAVLKTGGAYLPLDSDLPKGRISYILQDADVEIVLTKEEIKNKFEDLDLNLFYCDTDWDQLADKSKGNPECKVVLDDLAYVIYTSGTTGKPKGVLVEHRGLTNLVCWQQRRYGITDKDRTSHIHSIGFDASISEIWPYLSAGASIYIPDEETRISPEKLRDWLIEKQINLADIPTAMMEVLLTLKWPKEVALRYVATGGDRLRRYVDEDLPFQLINQYGLTEVSVISIDTLVPVMGERELPPIGKPIDNTDIYILNENLQVAPLMVAGEIYIGGSGLSRGYINNDKLNESKFIDNPFKPGEKIFKTGDMARYLPDGNIEYLGRFDKQVQLRGFRIELGEIESIIMEHKAVREAVVIAREDGEQDKRLVAYVVLDPVKVRSEDEEFPETILEKHLIYYLPEYMLPSVYVFLDEIPITVNGKIDIQSLPEPNSELRKESEYIASKTETEVKLKEIWEELLTVKRISANDHFFKLGGHSLLASQLISNMQANFGVRLTIRDLFEEPILNKLAKRIDNELESGNTVQVLSIKKIDRRAMMKGKRIKNEE